MSQLKRISKIFSSNNAYVLRLNRLAFGENRDFFCDGCWIIFQDFAPLVGGSELTICAVSQEARNGGI